MSTATTASIQPQSSLFSTGVGSSSSNTGLVSAAASASNPVGSSAATFGNFSFGACSSASSMTVGQFSWPWLWDNSAGVCFWCSPALSAATSALATSSDATSSMFSFGVNSIDFMFQ
ncbi:hypothetical protein BC332_14327 [Capsicum chinense]|nr:hypothetical protein FXO38_30439 [Capsicum annuum]KAF3637862.1 hypothetical protein FXO37_24675 [Capsicum annuum]PHU18632.1 hypothetical protein BC332_14327 [Capsicum chinense]